jgi:surface antigen
MRIAVLTGLFACVAVFSVTTEKSSAAPLELLQNAKEPTVLAILDEVAGRAEPEVTEIALAEPIVQKHVLAAGETLTTVAENYGTTWQRLFYKNTAIVDPNIVAVGTEIVIPVTGEVLEERALPAPPAPRVATVVRTNSERAVQNSAPVSSSGNRYVRGYCTWYVKNRRPDLPNNLGNASTWVSRAAAQGYSTGSTPVVGAVGQQGNHVVFVEAVHGDGTVTVSEMNWNGWNVVSSRTVSAGAFTYIY